MTLAKTHRTRVRKVMRDLGVYKPEYEAMIAIYADLCEQYDAITEQFVQSGYQFEEATNAGSKKAPIVTTLESLRKDILTYANALGLTPKGFQALEAPKEVKVSILEKALSGLG